MQREEDSEEEDIEEKVPPRERERDPAAIIPTRSITPGQIDSDALKVVRRLQRFGHSAYLVGGCVRDLLLKRTPKDFDVVTSASPTDVRKLFRNCRLIGRRFRLAHILFRAKIIETATFRAAASPQAEEGDLLIRSDNVFGTEREDAYRRDFTINALFFDPVERVLIDYIGGLEDLVAKKLRFIGDPDIRVREDPVRILRAIKFAARLGFQMEERTFRAVVRYKDELVRAAPPRLLEEILRMLRHQGAEESFRLMWETGALEVLLPEVAMYLSRSLDRGEIRDPGAGLFAYLRALDGLEQQEVASSAVLLAALLLHPVNDALACLSAYELTPASPAVAEVARELTHKLVERLRMPRRDAERIQQILGCQKRLLQLHSAAPLPRTLMRRVYFPEALDLFEVGVRATGRGRRVLARLRHSYRRVPPEATHEAAEDQPAAPPRRSRRRRRSQ